MKRGMITIKPKGGTVSTIADFKKLPLGTCVYLAGTNDIDWWYYGGINPKSPKSIMLINSGNVNSLTGVYIGDEPDMVYLLDYNDACRQLIANAKQNVETVTRVFTPKSAPTADQ